MEYDGIRNVSFFLNGKLNRKVALKNGGTLAPSVYPPVIGDRYSGTHYRFDGLIREGKTLIHTVHDKNSIGKILLLLPEKTGKIHLEMPFCAEKGETIRVKVSLSSSSGKKIKSLHPIALEIRDAAGKQTGDSTSGALVNGVYTQKLTIPLNAAKGTWKILARDPTSGKNLQKTLLIR